MRRILAISSLLTCAALGCASAPPAAPQVLLFVDTDAPLPHRSGQDASPPVFDRLLVELYPAGASAPCEGCRREIAITHEQVASGLSFGILTTGFAGAVIRLRLFPSWANTANGPLAATTVEQFVALPNVVDGKVEPMLAYFATDAVGSTAGALEAPLTPKLQEFAGGHPGSWAPAVQGRCDAPNDDEACVPGGAFWMGRGSVTLSGDVAGEPHLVALSPFYVDLHEATVGEVRAWGKAHPSVRAPGTDPVLGAPYCTYVEDGSFDARPLNCIVPADAAGFCASKGKSLPSEAQLEYLIGGTRTFRAPWGNDPPTCKDAVFDSLDKSSSCGKGDGPKLAGSGARDRLTLGDRIVLDLASNLREITADIAAPLAGSTCWPRGPLIDPICTTLPPDLRDLRYVLRGGSWTDPPGVINANNRQTTFAASSNAGFRCVRRAEGTTPATQILFGLNGHVTSITTGAGVAGAKISTVEDPAREATSGDDGAYVLVVEAGPPFTLRAEAAGYAPSLFATLAGVAGGEQPMLMRTLASFNGILSAYGGTPGTGVVSVTFSPVKTCDPAGATATLDPPSGRAVYRDASSRLQGTLTAVPTGGGGMAFVGVKPGSVRIVWGGGSTCKLVAYPFYRSGVTELGDIRVEGNALTFFEAFLQ